LRQAVSLIFRAPTFSGAQPRRHFAPAAWIRVRACVGTPMRFEADSLCNLAARRANRISHDSKRNLQQSLIQWRCRDDAKAAEHCHQNFAAGRVLRQQQSDEESGLHSDTDANQVSLAVARALPTKNARQPTQRNTCLQNFDLQLMFFSKANAKIWGDASSFLRPCAFSDSQTLQRSARHFCFFSRHFCCCCGQTAPRTLYACTFSLPHSCRQKSPTRRRNSPQNKLFALQRHRAARTFEKTLRRHEAPPRTMPSTHETRMRQPRAATQKIFFAHRLPSNSSATPSGPPPTTRRPPGGPTRSKRRCITNCHDEQQDQLTK
jgi:hypothetical protein